MKPFVRPGRTLPPRRTPAPRGAPPGRGGYRRPTDPRTPPAGVPLPTGAAGGLWGAVWPYLPVSLPIALIMALGDYWYRAATPGWSKCPTPNCQGTVTHWWWSSSSATCAVFAPCPEAQAFVPSAVGSFSPTARRLIFVDDNHSGGLPNTGTLREQWIRPAPGHPNFNRSPIASPGLPAPVTNPAPAPVKQPAPWSEPAYWPSVQPWADPWANPVPSPRRRVAWPIGVPVEVPLPGPLPSYPPSPRPQPNPRPNPRPRPVVHLVPSTNVELRPNQSPSARPGQHARVRDNSKKARVPAWMFAALKLYHGATEVGDFVESLADAMPKETGCSKLPGFQRAACVVENWDKIDWWQAAENVILNEVEDQIVGRGVGKLGDAGVKARSRGYHAPSTTQSTGHVRSTSKMMNF